MTVKFSLSKVGETFGHAGTSNLPLLFRRLSLECVNKCGIGIGVGPVEHVTFFLVVLSPLNAFPNSRNVDRS